MKTDLRVRMVYRDGLLAQVAEGYTPIMKGQTAIVSRADIEDALQKSEQSERLSKQERR